MFGWLEVNPLDYDLHRQIKFLPSQRGPPTIHPNHRKLNGNAAVRASVHRDAPWWNRDASPTIPSHPLGVSQKQILSSSPILSSTRSYQLQALALTAPHLRMTLLLQSPTAGCSLPLLRCLYHVASPSRAAPSRKAPDPSLHCFARSRRAPIHLACRGSSSRGGLL
jgi:hypothetical protein